MSNLFSRISSRISHSGDESSLSFTKGQLHARRREQVRRAQRTHRERSAKYLQGLEAEVAYLRAKDAKLSVKLRKAEATNTNLMNILQSHGIFLPPDIGANMESTYWLRIAEQDYQRGSRLNQSQIPCLLPPHDLVDVADPQIATDIILYLEQGCLDHLLVPSVDHESGHLLQMQVLIMGTEIDTTQPLNRYRIAEWSNNAVSKHQLQAQLDQLLETARTLHLPGELTPIMCWTKLKDTFGARNVSAEHLNRLLGTLLVGMSCRGFGAVIDEKDFYVALDTTVL